MRVKISASNCWSEDMLSSEVRTLSAITLMIIRMPKKKLEWLRLESGQNKKKLKVLLDTWQRMLMINNSLKTSREKH